MTENNRQDVLRHTAAIVAAHLGRNKTETQLVPELIRSVYQAVAGLGTAAPEAAAPQAPAVPIRRSVFPDYLVCLEDGAKMKMLKRYLHKRYGMTPAEYRAKWGLPSDYPMVAPNYSSHRSGLAKQLGLGRKPAVEENEEPELELEAAATEPEVIEEEAEEEPAPAPKPARKRRAAKA